MRLTKTVVERAPGRVEFHGHFNERPVNSGMCLELFQLAEVIEIVCNDVWSRMCGARVICSVIVRCVEEGDF